MILTPLPANCTAKAVRETMREEYGFRDMGPVTLGLYHRKAHIPLSQRAYATASKLTRVGICVGGTLHHVDVELRDRFEERPYLLFLSNLPVLKHHTLVRLLEISGISNTPCAYRDPENGRACVPIPERHSVHHRKGSSIAIPTAICTPKGKRAKVRIDIREIPKVEVRFLPLEEAERASFTKFRESFFMTRFPIRGRGMDLQLNANGVYLEGAAEDVERYWPEIERRLTAAKTIQIGTANKEEDTKARVDSRDGV